MMMKTLVPFVVALVTSGAQAQLPEAGAAAQPGSFLQVAADAGHRVVALATHDLVVAPTEATDLQLVIGIPPIPEPETYALMAAGLAALAFVVRRRKD